MLQPPSMPRARMILSEAERSIWYSLSLSVWLGATTMLSPVWTPIGSRFSMLQTVMQLSAAPRITSYSISFQPRRQRSSSTWLIGGAADRLDRSAEDADGVLIEDAGVGEGDGEVKAGLAAQRGEEAVRPLALNDAGDYGYGERLNVDGISDPLVGHDGGRVGVDEDGVDALLAEGAAG